jgi:hypothetical protein
MVSSCGCRDSNKLEFRGYYKNEFYCGGEVRKTNSRGFVALSNVVVVIFHRVAYCVVVFNLLVRSEVVSPHLPIGRTA